MVTNKIEVNSNNVVLLTGVCYLKHRLRQAQDSVLSTAYKSSSETESVEVLNCV